MTVELTRGANTAIPVSVVRAVLSWTARTGAPDVDASALLLTAAGKVRSDDDFVFYNQPRNASGSATHQGKRAAGGQLSDTLVVDLAGIEPIIDRVVIAASADGGTFGHVPDLRLCLFDGSGFEVARFDMRDARSETAFVAGELYRRGGTWKLRAVGQGYDSGLAGLATDFGINVDAEAEDLPAPPAPEPTPASEPAPHPALLPDDATPMPSPTANPGIAPPAGGLAMTKPPLGTISLQKNQRVSISKGSRTRITASLKWTKRKDLDLYALYVDTAGQEGVCYYRNLGSLTQAPFISLISGDSREPGIETIEISRPDALRHVLICAYSAVENGFGSFKSFGAYVEVTDHAGSIVTSPLFHKNSFAYWVAIAHIDLSNSHEASIAHVETYSKGGSERRPLLRSDGTFEMNKGPVEFKGKRLQKLAERQNRRS